MVCIGDYQILNTVNGLNYMAVILPRRHDVRKYGHQEYEDPENDVNIGHLEVFFFCADCGRSCLGILRSLRVGCSARGVGQCLLAPREVRAEQIEIRLQSSRTDIQLVLAAFSI